MNEPTFTLYLDESGNEILYPEERYQANKSLETHCTLIGTIVPHNTKDSLKDQLNQLKQEIWGTEEIILHSVEIRNKTGPFSVFNDVALYEYFKSETNRITKEIGTVIICSSLNKQLWVSKYPKKLLFGDDPYGQAFIYLLERYNNFLENSGTNARGKIIAEMRGNPKQNKALAAEYENFRNYGTQYLNKPPYAKLAEKMEFKKKSMNIPGLQLADYCCYPFYKNHKRPDSDNKHYEFLEKLVYPGERNKYGHKKWPV